jgi:hypothetical protein
VNLATVELFGAASSAEFTALGPLDVSPQRRPDGRLSSEKAQEVVATALRDGSHFLSGSTSGSRFLEHRLARLA